ncbi:hypothetical protein CEXT_405471 [Caerostris extrusa]|uniref:Uncharacterized protein n=1 Tax=Caerostris extrusa TaxID=172846 RepID=A0AAV4NVM7_CAEEX|nr:hypothetical protein CEXT_405471 [Caerostris extrusa]
MKSVFNFLKRAPITRLHRHPSKAEGSSEAPLKVVKVSFYEFPVKTNRSSQIAFLVEYLFTAVLMDKNKILFHVSLSAVVNAGVLLALNVLNSRGKKQ